MSNTTIASLGLSLLLLLTITALTFKLRQWVKNLYSELAVIRKELLSLKASIVDPNSNLTKAIKSAALESVNATCLAPLGLKFPVFLGDWSIDTFFGRWLVQHLLEKRPKCIVELGSGSSTVLIARTLSLLGEKNVTHIAVDHDEKYLGLTRDTAALNGLHDQVTFLHCPLTQYESLNMLWYGNLLPHLEDLQIDLLIIDGPPGNLQPLSRHPALPLLLKNISAKGTVILDDANRPDENTIAHQWLEESPDFKLNLIHEGHGLAILSRE